MGREVTNRVTMEMFGVLIRPALGAPRHGPGRALGCHQLCRKAAPHAHSLSLSIIISVRRWWRHGGGPGDASRMEPRLEALSAVS